MCCLGHSFPNNRFYKTIRVNKRQEIIVSFLNYKEQIQRWDSREGHCCSATGLRFNSQYLHRSLQPSLTLTPGYQCPVLASSHTRHVFSYRHTCGQNTHTLGYRQSSGKNTQTHAKNKNNDKTKNILLIFFKYLKNILTQIKWYL